MNDLKDTLKPKTPKICVPLTSTTSQTLLQEIQNAIDDKPDLLEWRADFFHETEYIVETLKEIKKATTIPLIFTWRTHHEGGGEITLQGYKELIIKVVATGLIEYVDIEYGLGDAIVSFLIDESHKYGIKVILSNHDFDQTPSQEEIYQRLLQMKNLGGDIQKIAVMPRSSQDVLTLLSATNQFYQDFPESPIVTMSMGQQGVISRISGYLFGSAMTFATIGASSAPGQIPIDQLRKAIEILS